jgi:hypothetical protein
MSILKEETPWTSRCMSSRRCAVYYRALCADALESLTSPLHVRQAETLGMDSHSASLALPDAPDAEWRVDVPMRAFQGGYYPQLIRLYTHLGVAFRKADFSYSFTTLAHPPEREQSAKTLDLRPHFLYEGASGKKGLAIPAAKCTKAEQEPSFIRRTFARTRLNLVHTLGVVAVLFLWLRFIILCAPSFRPKNIHEMTWEEWVAKYSPSGPLARWTGLAAAWERFLNELCMPMYSCICSANRDDVFQHPAEEFLGASFSPLTPEQANVPRYA